MSPPFAYFITFHCYGSWLHGAAPGSVDAEHNQVGTPFLPADPERQRAARQAMDQPAYVLDVRRRAVVLEAIRQVCTHRGWHLFAAHVRSSHVHAVVRADCPPEKVMNDFKAYASRALNAAALDPEGRKRWSRHGSTRYLNEEAAVPKVVEYVLRRQGEPMAVHDGTNDPNEPRP